MKKIGIIGGLGPESTLIYYSEILNAFKETYRKTGFPEVCIESIDLNKFLQMAENSDWEKIALLISDLCNNLQASGAEFGVIASNSPHKVFSQIKEQTSLPLVSIVEATMNYAIEKKYKKLILLGTEFTMSSDYYQQAFSKANIKLFTPDISEQAYIQDKLFSEIGFGVFKESTRHGFLSIIKRLEKLERAEGVILGCTELPLIISPLDVDINYIDATRIHIKAIIDYCKS